MKLDGNELIWHKKDTKDWIDKKHYAIIASYFDVEIEPNNYSKYMYWLIKRGKV